MRSAQVSPPSRPLHGLMQAGSLTMLQTRPARSSSEAFLPVAHYSCSPSQRAPQRGQERASMAGGQCCGRFPGRQRMMEVGPKKGPLCSAERCVAARGAALRSGAGWWTTAHRRTNGSAVRCGAHCWTPCAMRRAALSGIALRCCAERGAVVGISPPESIGLGGGVWGLG
jgi:hypothetical protein